ncbi:MAG: PIN domain-containing protein [Chloroflexi bacterium]|nr:MAG: PIN domain-containing protein [Chloroflexota bacterium]
MAERELYVTDTHSLLWHLYDIPRLAAGASAAFEAVSRGDSTLLIPAIVLAEVVYIVERRFPHLSVDSVLDRIAAADNFRILPFGLGEARAMIAMDAIPEMHDRIIVAAAYVFGAPLITRDGIIRLANVVECVWE